jgi:hypothetical protein
MQMVMDAYRVASERGTRRAPRSEIERNGCAERAEVERAHVNVGKDYIQQVNSDDNGRIESYK